MLPIPRAAGKRSSRCRALHLRRPLPRPLQQGLHFRGPSDDLWCRHLVRRGRQSRRQPRNAKGPVQPVAAAPQGEHRLVLGHAPRRRRSTSSTSGDDRLGSLDTRLPQAASERRGPRRVQAVVAQRLPWVHASIVRTGQEGRPRELSGRSWEGHSVVALVSRFKGCSRIGAEAFR